MDSTQHKCNKQGVETDEEREREREIVKNYWKSGTNTANRPRKTEKAVTISAVSSLLQIHKLN